MTAYLYCVTEAGADAPCKVGVAKSLSKRMSALQCGNWRELSYAWTIQFASEGAAYDTEEMLLLRLRGRIDGRLKSEWVSADQQSAFALACEFTPMMTKAGAA